MTFDNIRGRCAWPTVCCRSTGSRWGLRRQGYGFGQLLDGPRIPHPSLKLDADFANASFRQTFEQLEMVQQLVPIFAKTGGDYSLSLHLQTSLDAQMSPDLKTLSASGEIRSENIDIRILRHSMPWLMRWATTACARLRPRMWRSALPSGRGGLRPSPSI